MTTAWLVWQGEWDGRRLYGAYASEEVANAWAEHARKTAEFVSERRSVKVEAKELVEGLPPPAPDRWLTPDEERERVEESEPLEGKILVVTGTLPKRSRDEVKDLIVAAGGTVNESVGKSAAYLVAGENPGSKLDKAKELGVPVISEADLEKLLGLDGPSTEANP